MTFKLYIFTIFLITLPVLLVAQENDAISCSDGIDNDGDGLIDCEDGDCLSFSNDGCAICSDGISFADVLIEYIPGCPLEDDNPLGILGLNDWTGGSEVDEPQVVILGQGGSIKAAFTNNLITNSGNLEDDIWVFEVGPVVEACNIALRPFDAYTESQLSLLNILDSNGDGYFEFGQISGSTSGIDIDTLMPGYPANVLLFDAIEIEDVPNAPCGTSNTPGADIDAVCAIFTVEVDCEGVIGGSAILDDCEQCLQANDPNFNNCLDCAGTPFGNAIIDDCGECIEPDDESFNACYDCDGVPFGTALLDNCEQCLQPDAPDFNNCLDCAGIPFGNAIIDECGECLELYDDYFNACFDCEGVPFGTAILDDCLQADDTNFNNCLDCAGTPFGNAIIDECGLCLEPNYPAFNQSCNNVTLIYVPNAFTPDNDGLNEVFLPIVSGISSNGYSFKIFNRWGEKIFESFNRDTPWIGDYKDSNDFVPDGVYVWQLVVKNKYTSDIESFAGHVSVNR